MLTLLEEMAGPVPTPLASALYRWEEESGGIAVRQVVLLEARDPLRLRELTAQRRIRETLRETLSARAVRVDSSRLGDLLRRLERRGIYPRLDLAAEVPLPADGLGAEDRVLVAVALRLYARLADALRLDVRLPHTLAHTWNQGLSLSQRDETDRLVDEAWHRLHQAYALAEEDHPPAPVGPLLARLEEAIGAGETVEIEYYTPARDHRTVRRVEPLRLEWRGETLYLIAHCHMRGDQRVFRVDRILALRSASQE